MAKTWNIHGDHVITWSPWIFHVLAITWSPWIFHVLAIFQAFWWSRTKRQMPVLTLSILKRHKIPHEFYLHFACHQIYTKSFCFISMYVNDQIRFLIIKYWINNVLLFQCLLKISGWKYYSRSLIALIPTSSTFKLGFVPHVHSMGCNIFTLFVVQTLPQNWTSSLGYSIYHIGDQRRLRQACASTQSCQSLRWSYTWSMEVDEGSDQNLTSSSTGWLCMHIWRMSLRRTKSAIISWWLINVGSLV